MLKLATTLLGLTLTLGSVQANQTRNNVQVFSNASECTPTGIIEQVVQKEHGEQPFSKSKILLQSSKTARLYEGNLVIYVNSKTKTYTLVVQFDDNVSCILGAGGNFAPAFMQQNSVMK
jgi:hypothetical protein